MLALDTESENKGDASCYERVAAEYYDALRHPTCDNFRAASSIYIRSALIESKLDGNLADIGAGRSVAAEILIEKSESLRDLILLDGSAEMLSHSRQFIQAGARAVVGDACTLPLASQSICMCISSLGDSFNVQSFWFEIARCLRPGGICIFTTPSYEWASGFREFSNGERQGRALFELMSGRLVYVPSFILPTPDQITMINRAGLDVIGSSAVNADLVPPPHSKKIARVGGIVTGYKALRK